MLGMAGALAPHARAVGMVTVLVNVPDAGITLTLTDSEAALGAVDPGQMASDAVTGTVRSSKRWQLTYVATDLSSATDTIAIEEVRLEGTAIPAPIVLSAQGTIYPDMPKYPNPRHPFSFSHVFSITLPWTVDPGSYRGLIVYSASQR